jgi:hypothetical protein
MAMQNTKASVRSCSNCQYFKPIDKNQDRDVLWNNSICRRFPPNYGAWWAIVKEEDWCGEHTPLIDAVMETAGAIGVMTDKMFKQLGDQKMNEKDEFQTVEKGRRSPLELTHDLHICLWTELRDYKCTIALWTKHKEGYEVRFVGDRPLDGRVNWKDFEKLIRKGQAIADAQWSREHLD